MQFICKVAVKFLLGVYTLILAIPCEGSRVVADSFLIQVECQLCVLEWINRVPFEAERESVTDRSVFVIAESVRVCLIGHLDSFDSLTFLFNLVPLKYCLLL